MNFVSLGMGAVIAFQSISEIPSKYRFIFYPPLLQKFLQKENERSFGEALVLHLQMKTQAIGSSFRLTHSYFLLPLRPSTFKLCVLEPEILLNFSYKCVKIYLYIS